MGPVTVVQQPEPWNAGRTARLMGVRLMAPGN
jgi:hypothetical protein